jgi:3-oxoacyl-[acyl-carrier protein] reductase
LIGNAGQANYSASKAGIIGLTKSVAREVASRGITVNAIAPGFIESSMTEKLSDDTKSEILKNIPAKKFGTPEDVAAAVGFICSERARYINGHVLNVDGGMAA